MKKKTAVVIFIAVISLLLQGCASLYYDLDKGSKISKSEKKIMVFPFRNPYYKGRQIEGIGQSFAAIFVSEIQSTGRTCEMAMSGDFTESASIDVIDACNYARQHGSDIAIIGIVTEWLDGATQWSGKVDVAAVIVHAYDSQNHKLISSASGRQSGQWFTFVNAPTTRFMRPLSQMVAKSLFQ